MDSEAISSKLVIPLEVIIGTVPLRSSSNKSSANSPAPLAVRSIDLHLDQ